MTEISVVVPVYLCADCLRALNARLVTSLDRLGVPYEIIFVDDGSPDGAEEVIFGLARADDRVLAVRAGRNFGEEAAIRMGLARSTGRWVVVIDCDLQDAPEDIPRLYAKAREGNDIVMTHRRRRTGDSRPRVLGSRIYHAAVGTLVHHPIDPYVANFSIASREAAEICLANPKRQYRLVLQQLELPRAAIDVERSARYAGSSSYSPARLVRHSIAGLMAEARARRAAASADGELALLGSGKLEPYHETLARVEADHWWLAALREVVVESLLATTEPGGRVLDVGCSTGHVLARVPADYVRIGLEANAGAVALARTRHPDVEFVHARAEALPFDDDSFDAVITTDVLSDGGVDDLAALEEIRRVLRPGGTLILHVAAYESLLSGHDRAVGTGRRYRSAPLERLLMRAGFTPSRITYRVTVLFPLALVHRLLTRRGARGDVDDVPPLLNRVLSAIMRTENALLRRRDLPFGLSVLALATVPRDAAAARAGRASEQEAAPRQIELGLRD